MSHEGSGQDTRTKILEVAEREFALRGFAGAHLQQIAEQVGVQKTALYYYFPSKEALYVDILSSMLGALEATLGAAMESQGSYAERFKRMLDALNDLLAERRNYSQILVRILVDRVAMEGQPLRPTIERMVGRQLAFYREGRDAGAFARLSARHLYQTIQGAVVFHYATDSFGAAVLDVDDIFTHGSVAWRREEVSRALLRLVLAEPEAETC